MSQSTNQQPEKKKDAGRFKTVFSWDEKRVSLVKKDEIDLKEAMKERAKGVSLYELLERYHDPELIPGYGENVYESRDEKNKILDLTNVPEFGTDVLNMQKQQAEELYAQKQKEALEAAKKAEEAKKAAEEAKKAREAAINKLLEKGGEQQ